MKEEKSEKFFYLMHRFLNASIESSSSAKRTTVFEQVELEVDQIDFSYRSKDKVNII